MRRAWALAAISLAGCEGASSADATSGAGASGATSSASTAGGASSSASSASSGDASSGVGGASGACAMCGGTCVDLANDALHCGACEIACPDKTLCDHGACKPPLCLVVGPICPNDHLCCGDACCPSWKTCCNALDGGAPSCLPVDAGACPTPCAACR